MDELRVEIALEIIQKKIVHLLKNNKGEDMNTIKESLKTMVDEREKIYDLDKDIIYKVYDVYLEEIKRGEYRLRNLTLNSAQKRGM